MQLANQMPIFRLQLFRVLLKTVNGSKIYVTTMPMIISFKALIYLYSGKI